MDKNPCLSRIRTEYSHLTAREKLVADCILQHASQVVGMTISELADQAGVVKSVVVRCCQSLGFSGYAAFKLSLSRELARNEQFRYTPYISPQDEPADIFGKIFAANIKTLHDTLAGLDRRTLEQAVELLNGAEDIYIYGVGTSAGIARDFQYRLMQLGRRAFCFTDVPTMKVSTMNIRPGDVAVAISNSGRTAATVDSLALARERGAATIGLTSYAHSELTARCDCALVVLTDEIQYPTEPISARVAHISVLDALAVSLSAKNYDQALERSAQTVDLINTVRY